MGIVILVKAVRLGVLDDEPSRRGMPVVGFVGGLLDAIGGGGWGPIVTSDPDRQAAMSPRFVIGSVNLTEFLVTVVDLGDVRRHARPGRMSLPVIPLILGGLVIAPFAGYLTRSFPTRLLMC